MVFGGGFRFRFRKGRLRAFRVLGAEAGQSTVEAAFALPVLITLVLLMMQPAIVLYDYMVMNAAAFEACRLMATLPASQQQYCEDFVRRRLGAVPQQDCFHVHDGDSCSWDIQVEGDETVEQVTVVISNKIKPLPILNAGSRLLGLLDAEGCIELKTRADVPTQPSWVYAGSGTLSPSSWVGDWID